MRVVINTKSKPIVQKLFGYILSMANDERFSTSVFYRLTPATPWQQFLRYRDVLESKTDIIVCEGFIDDIIPRFTKTEWDKLNEPEFKLKEKFEQLLKADQNVQVAITEQRGMKESTKKDKDGKEVPCLIDVPLTDIAPIDLDESILKQWPAVATMFTETSIVSLHGLSEEKADEQLKSIATALVQSYVEARDAAFNEGAIV